MAGWIFDEDITRVAVNQFIKAGIRGLHIKDDLKKGGISDEQVLKTAQKQKATLITANTSDFLGISDVDYLGTHGAWILGTEDPEEQVELVKLTQEATGIKTSNQRKEKKLHIKQGEVVVLDCRTKEKTTYKLPARKKT